MGRARDAAPIKIRLTRPTRPTGPTRPTRATRPGERCRGRADVGLTVFRIAGSRALHGGAGVARVHFSPRSDQRVARRRVAVDRSPRRTQRPADQFVDQWVALRRALGVLEFLGRRTVALQRADHGALEDLRDAAPGLFRLSAVRARVLHDLRVRAPSRDARRTGDRPMIRHALVLTAGLGTRLQPLTNIRAKPAIPVGGDPMIRRIIRTLVAQGVDDLVLNLHHLPATLTAVVGDGGDLGARVRYSWEPEILGSGGGPRLARPLVGAETFWIVNGDTLTDVALGPLAAAHAESNARVTLAL